MSDENPEVILVKVQLSLASSDGLKHMLVYNKDKSVFAQFEMSDETLKMMGYDPNNMKSYWWATLVPNGEGEDTKSVQLLTMIDEEEYSEFDW